MTGHQRMFCFVKMEPRRSFSDCSNLLMWASEGSSAVFMQDKQCRSTQVSKQSVRVRACSWESACVSACACHCTATWTTCPILKCVEKWTQLQTRHLRCNLPPMTVHRLSIFLALNYSSSKLSFLKPSQYVTYVFSALTTTLTTHLIPGRSLYLHCIR